MYIIPCIIHIIIQIVMRCMAQGSFRALGQSAWNTHAFWTASFKRWSWVLAMVAGIVLKRLRQVDQLCLCKLKTLFVYIDFLHTKMVLSGSFFLVAHRPFWWTSWKRTNSLTREGYSCDNVLDWATETNARQSPQQGAGWKWLSKFWQGFFEIKVIT